MEKLLVIPSRKHRTFSHVPAILLADLSEIHEMMKLHAINTCMLADQLPYRLIIHRPGPVLVLKKEWFEYELTDASRVAIVDMCYINGWAIRTAKEVASREIEPACVPDIAYIYESQFHIHKWHPVAADLMPVTKLIAIPRRDRDALRCISWQHAKSQICASPAVRNILGVTDAVIRGMVSVDFLNALERAIQLTSAGGGSFLRTQSSSYQSDRPVEPVTDAVDAIHKLCAAKSIFTDPLEYLVVTPWWSSEPREEFRAFVYRRRLTAVCARKWNVVSKMSPEWQRSACVSVGSLCSKLAQRMEFSSMVVDVLVTETNNRKRSTLIDINPWGGGFSTGSGLFDWVGDSDILESKKTPVPLLAVVKNS